MPKFVNFEKKQKNTFTHTSYIHHRLMSCFVWKLVDRFSDNCIVSFNSTSVAVLGDTNCFNILLDSSVRLKNCSIEVVIYFLRMTLFIDYLKRANAFICIWLFISDVAATWPPCIRMIVTESTSLAIGTLFIVTCTGCSIGRDKSDISIEDVSISKVSTLYFKITLVRCWSFCFRKISCSKV